MSNDIFGGEKEELDLRLLSPALLAYVGDAVYELFVRNYLVRKGWRRARDLHRQAVKYVQAQAQAAVLTALLSELDEEELEVVRRGRNAKIGQYPRNIDKGVYRLATAWEALWGYHFFRGNQKRLQELFSRACRILEGEG